MLEDSPFSAWKNSVIRGYEITIVSFSERLALFFTPYWSLLSSTSYVVCMNSELNRSRDIPRSIGQGKKLAAFCISQG